MSIGFLDNVLFLLNIYKVCNMAEKPEDTRTLKLVVFLNDKERLDFKVACAKENIAMSAKARELILKWSEDNK